jgi:group II intron reverse transcriptase/maturase
MTLDPRTHAEYKISTREHIWNHSGQLDLFPNRWLRIGSAARKKELVFNNLLCHFTVDSLREAFTALDGSKAVGTDGMSKKVYGTHLEKNLQNLVRRIHVGSYKPQIKRQFDIPKANGKARPIAISCFEDKLVEWVLGKILSAIYEPIFIRNSFGFRPYHSVDHAVQAIHCSLKDDIRPFVVEIDFANFFNSIPHKKLMKIISKRISDRRLKGLIGRFLKVGILDQSGFLSHPDLGTPQGSIMSPILANVYLHDVLDAWFLENYASYTNIIVRYADDAVFFFKSQQVAESFLQELKGQAAKFGLALNEDKSGIIGFGKNDQQSLHFLGFTFYWGKKKPFSKRPLKIKTCQKTLLKKIQAFNAWIKSVRNKLKLPEIWKLAKAKLSGHFNYYGYSDNRHKLNHFYCQAIKSLFTWLNRRSQKRSYSWAQFHDRLKFNPLPVPPPMSKLKHLRKAWGYV